MNNIINSIKTGATAFSLAFASLIIGAGSVSATTGYALSVPINTVKTGAEGSMHELVTKNIDQRYVGSVCSVNATAKNQESVHPGNNLVVATGNSSVTLVDVERVGGVVTTAEGSLTLGDKLTVTLKMGKDKVFSGGMDVNVTCEEKEIEVCRDHAVITIKESDRRDTDTTAPCPVKVIEVCRDNKVVTIKENERKDSDKNAPCPVKNIKVCRDGKVVTIKEDQKKNSDTSAPCPVKEIEVCRDNKVVKIKENERKDSDKNAPCPEVKAAVTLPNTGAGSIAGLIGVTFAGSTVVAQLKMRRNAAKRS